MSDKVPPVAMENTGAALSKVCPAKERKMMTCSTQVLTGVVLACLMVAPAKAADDHSKTMITPSFWRTSQLYELCISQYQTDRAHCEGFITGVVSTLMNDQISRVRVCLPKGTSSNDVVQKVVWYLREKADPDDMKMAAVTIVGPILPILYNCTPGQRPSFLR